MKRYNLDWKNCVSVACDGNRNMNYSYTETLCAHSISEPGHFGRSQLEGQIQFEGQTPSPSSSLDEKERILYVILNIFFVFSNF